MDVFANELGENEPLRRKAPQKNRGRAFLPEKKAPMPTVQNLVEITGLQLKKCCYLTGMEYRGPGVPWPLVYDPVLEEVDYSKANKLFACFAHLKNWLRADRVTSAHNFALVEQVARTAYKLSTTPPPSKNVTSLNTFSSHPDSVSIEEYLRQGDYYWLLGEPERSTWDPRVLPRFSSQRFWSLPKPGELLFTCFNENHEFTSEGHTWPLREADAERRFCSIACLLRWMQNNISVSVFIALELLHEYIWTELGWAELPAPAPDKTCLERFAFNGMTIERFRSLGDYYRPRKKAFVLYDRPSTRPWTGLDAFVSASEIQARANEQVIAVVQRELVSVAGMSVSPVKKSSEKKSAEVEEGATPAAIFRAMMEHLKTRGIKDMDVSMKRVNHDEDDCLVPDGPMQEYRGNGVTIRTRAKVPASMLKVVFLLRVDLYIFSVEIASAGRSRAPRVGLVALWGVKRVF